ncbi:MAG TPA: ribonuclease D [Methylococcaceae bacterium]|jgi:ribonuclease D|nr:ribonuclease D [Methylococcaceae bacterium]HIN68561.1 ribonuclease D [Methylococcales bacterium]HIA45558.1 ribonuclease D [Methylococcaceae bacterium]HIB62842.1 ribonuclease D [Methylococcaceae bacterium]HIO12200.1 ribonuclease D [Methylococcales bacterium]
MEIQYINTPEKLALLCQDLAGAPWLALDTEFLREKTYYSKFCLLQIATPSLVACVDPLALETIDNLLDIIYNPEIVKVFHSARQDLEIFYHLRGSLPAPVFDTQVAAPLLGFQDNPGYAMLVSSWLNVNLTKEHTRTDWSSRPLSEGQVAYAADDVIYLAEIYQRMLKKLTDLGRLSWLKDDFDHLSDVTVYQANPEQAWLKIRGLKKLTKKQLSVAQSLAQWRERIAQQENRPRNWLLRDDLIIDLARLQPNKIGELIKVRNLHERTVKRHGHELCALIQQAVQKEPVQRVETVANAEKNHHHDAIVDVLNAVVRIRAKENSINPSVLASRKQLDELLQNASDSCLLQGWRASMVGNELLAIISGEFWVSVAADTIQISSSEEITNNPVK